MDFLFDDQASVDAFVVAMARNRGAVSIIKKLHVRKLHVHASCLLLYYCIGWILMVVLSSNRGIQYMEDTGRCAAV